MTYDDGENAIDARLSSLGAFHVVGVEVSIPAEPGRPETRSVRIHAGMSLYQKVLGHPIVYDRIRPLLLGGIDMSPVFDRLGAGGDDVVLDVGCGTGVALDYLPPVRRYVGFDTDTVAIERARRKAQQRPEVSFMGRLLEASDLTTIEPSRVVLAGLLHHLTDAQCLDLLGSLRNCPSVRRVTTLDVAFLPGRLVNNLLSVMDRGQYVRPPDCYVRLAEAAGFLVQGEAVPATAKARRVAYWVMVLEPPPSVPVLDYHSAGNDDAVLTP